MDPNKRQHMDNTTTTTTTSSSNNNSSSNTSNVGITLININDPQLSPFHKFCAVLSRTQIKSMKIDAKPKSAKYMYFEGAQLFGEKDVATTPMLVREFYPATW